jgi:hypothetical protein
MPHGVPKLLKKYSNYTLLILDEWLIQTPSEPQLHFLFELIERRYDENATIFCTQYKFEDWHARLGGGVLADSIMDRVVHRTISVYSGDLNMREFLATVTIQHPPEKAGVLKNKPKYCEIWVSKTSQIRSVSAFLKHSMRGTE